MSTITWRWFSSLGSRLAAQLVSFIHIVLLFLGLVLFLRCGIVVPINKSNAKSKMVEEW